MLDPKKTLLTVLQELRGIVKEGKPAYERMARNIQARRDKEIDSLISEAISEE